MNKTVIAVDIGYGNTKVVWSHSKDKFGKNVWGESCFRSITPNVTIDEAATGTYNPNRILVEHKGKRFYAGPDATMGIEARLLDPNYIESDQHEVLLRASIHIAMRKIGRVFDSIDMLVLGLPVSGFKARGMLLTEIAKEPRQVPIPRELQTAGGPTSITVKAKQVKILPQPFGSLRYAIQELPDNDPVFSERSLSMVIDPGYRTFDWFVTNGLNPELKLSGSFDGGVSSIFREVSQEIGYDHGTGSLEFDQVEEGIKNGSINLGYKVIDTTTYQSAMHDQALKQVMTFLGRIDSNKSRLTSVFLTGGGASYYEKELRDCLPGYKIELIDNSVMGNARGYWMSGCDELAD